MNFFMSRSKRSDAENARMKLIMAARRKIELIHEMRALGIPLSQSKRIVNPK